MRIERGSRCAGFGPKNNGGEIVYLFCGLDRLEDIIADIQQALEKV